MTSVVLVENSSEDGRRVEVRKAQLSHRPGDTDERCGPPDSLHLSAFLSDSGHIDILDAHVTDQGVVGEVGVA